MPQDRVTQRTLEIGVRSLERETGTSFVLDRHQPGDAARVYRLEVVDGTRPFGPTRLTARELHDRMVFAVQCFEEKRKTDAARLDARREGR